MQEAVGPVLEGVDRRCERLRASPAVQGNAVRPSSLLTTLSFPSSSSSTTRVGSADFRALGHLLCPRVQLLIQFIARLKLPSFPGCKLGGAWRKYLFSTSSIGLVSCLVHWRIEWEVD